MPKYILRVEGVDFAATIDDTHNLSAYRGGSLALLAAPRKVEKFLKGEAAARDIGFDVAGWDENNPKSAPPARIYAAASQGAWWIDAKDNATAEGARAEVEKYLRQFGDNPESGDPPFAYCSFVVDVAPGNDLAALKQAEANGHERQLRCANWKLPEYDEEARSGSVGWDETEKKWKPVHLDRIRPATVDGYVKKQKVKVSPSFEARFEYGRYERHNFYKKEAGASKADGLDFAEDFEDIVEEAPEGLATSISGKIAVFYADGNKFTKARDKSKSVAELRDFSEKLLQYQRDMLGGLLDWLRAGGADTVWEAYLQYPRTTGKEGKVWPLRFETLLWGGDELTFVMPAWLGIDFAQRFHNEWTKEKDGTVWKSPGGDPLTFGIGLVFCDAKTPIRQVRKVAKEGLAESAKSVFDEGKPENVLQIEAFESIALPEYENGLARYRAKLFSLDDFDEKKLAEALTLRGGKIDETIKAIKALKDGAFPRSKIYDLLRIAKKQNGGFLPDGAGGAVDEELVAETRKYLRRMKRNEDEGLATLRILGNDIPLAYSLALVSGLWDYVDPLANVPTKTAVGRVA